ncbi:unnamed protein product [Notodromas monacha]|uniref:Uncharacterized protein n=1 Tax=Notodromas monacha TaxID=399045 RepID=A0A7R9BRN5_9CRUS|nr:unnamed protein product [Notodromas monacha]CAG0920448.1 unnamed protein product [Notodromas monacha]
MALMGLSLSWVLLLLASSISACPQNLGSCRCNPSPIPRMKPVLDCSEVSDHNDFLKIEGLHSAQPGGRPVFSQIVIRRSEIQEIPPGAFGIAEADEYIIENNPQLEKIERAGLGFHANPKVISIKNNPLLEVIQFEGYSSLRDLEVLRLNDNRLQEVADFAFDGMSPKLREINLERNVILDIGSFPFRNLPGLKTLLLAENQIGDLGTSSLFFSAPPDLVDLSRNRIVTVDNDAFSDATSRGANGAYAKHINLSNNRIRPPAASSVADPVQPPAQERGIQTENLLLKILERLQALTLPAQSASAPSIGVTAAALNPENPLHRILRKRAIGPLTTIAEAAKGNENVVNPVVEELQAAIPDQVPEQVASAIPSGAVEANEQLMVDLVVVVNNLFKGFVDVETNLFVGYNDDNLVFGNTAHSLGNDRWSQHQHQLLDQNHPLFLRGSTRLISLEINLIADAVPSGSRTLGTSTKINCRTFPAATDRCRSSNSTLATGVGRVAEPIHQPNKILLTALERGWTSIKETVSSLNIGGRIDSALASARSVNVSSSIDSFISSLKNAPTWSEGTINKGPPVSVVTPIKCVASSRPDGSTFSASFLPKKRTKRLLSVTDVEDPSVMVRRPIRVLNSFRLSPCGLRPEEGKETVRLVAVSPAPTS